MPAAIRGRPSTNMELPSVIQIVGHRLSSLGAWGTVRDQACRSVLGRDGKSTVSFRDNQHCIRFGIYRIHP